MKVFNAIQCVVFYAAAPFGLAWLFEQEFPWHSAASIAGGLLYLAYSIFIAVGMFTAFEVWEK